MEDTAFQKQTKQKIADGILKPLSLNEAMEYVKYCGASGELKETYESFLKLYEEGKIEMFWSNETNDIIGIRARNYPMGSGN